MGVVAVLWTLDCFVGAALTFPPRGAAPATVPGWLRGWARAWWISGRRLFTVAFTAHWAAGLWLWMLLLAVAWSAVGMNLSEVQRPVVGLLGTEGHWSEVRELPAPRPTPSSSPAEALARARALLHEEAAARGFEVLLEERLRYDPASGTWQYRAFTTLDVNERYPGTAVWFDDRTGQLTQFHGPTGQATGNTLTAWVDALHFGAVFGLVGRVGVALLGVAIAALSVTGVWIWWRKRGARRVERAVRAA